MSQQIHPLRAYRETQGITQEQVAALAATSRATICRIEAGAQHPGRPLRKRLVAVTNGAVSEEVLLNWGLDDDAGPQAACG
jgi:DNA-binding XRE family transcriptional regulator